ncbi:hypothetical protein [Halobacteriovorax sp. HLS]|uniref:hypothetical protein n=1 Tax=Halobacteriovorax sp. HLS TaxID=2234000 RepID=UPI000FD72F7D|nr:hypothetical protein [Halobacteriovorax sp. HLS]
MALNHYFTLIDESFPQKEELLKQGFILYGPRCHKGQGTSAQFVLFPKNYIEYIWIDDLKSSENNLLQLYMREQSHACKYGLCFSGVIPKEHIEEFVLYKPPYSLNSKLMILKESIDDLSMPLIFVDVNSKDPQDSEPRNNKNLSADLFNQQERFFIPKDLKDYKIPKYFRDLI